VVSDAMQRRGWGGASECSAIPVPTLHPDVEAAKGRTREPESRVGDRVLIEETRADLEQKRWRSAKVLSPVVLTDDPTRSMLDVADNSGVQKVQCTG